MVPVGEVRFLCQTDQNMLPFIKLRMFWYLGDIYVLKMVFLICLFFNCSPENDIFVLNCDPTMKNQYRRRKIAQNEKLGQFADLRGT